ncbi:MAG: hypothetical protein ACREJ2_11155 [Planctomycetota bacterium]
MKKLQLAVGLLLATGLTIGALGRLCAEDTKPVDDFENDQDMGMWEFAKGKGELTTDHATSGKMALKTDSSAYLTSWNVPKDWSGYEAFDIDIYVAGDNPVGMSLLIGDKAWQAKGSTYWNRHNGEYNLHPGQNTVEIPVNGLFRGEAGSRNTDLHSNIDPKDILRMDVGFRLAAKGVPPVAIYIDNMRLVKEAPPAGVYAFDLGPDSQTVLPGFTPISWDTVYGQKGNTAGLDHIRWGASQARDDTFPTRLYQDFVEMGDGSAQFICKVPNGKYNVWVVYDDCGYWGGETCHHKRRSIDAEGVEKYVDDRGEEGPSDYLFRFENTEPLPGDSVWDLYVKKLFKPAEFTTDVHDGALNLQFHSDAGWSSKVAAIIIYPEGNKEDADWVKGVEARNKKEFEDRAIFLGPKPHPLDVPEAAKNLGYWLGYPTLEQDIEPVGDPGPATGALSRTAALGERVSTSFAIRPLKDLGAGDTTLTATDLTGPAGTIPASAVDLRYVMYALHRGFNNIAYTIGPETLRLVDGAHLALKVGLTRQFWITVAVPTDAKPGEYKGAVTLTAGTLNLTLPLTIQVLNLALDEPDFDMGFYGLDVPSGLSPERAKNGYRELLTILKQNGMNDYSGGPNIPFTGFDADGKPKLDFRACDAFFKVAKECGFTRTPNAYGGPGMVEGLQDGYVLGPTAHKWMKETGKSFGDLLKIVYGAVKAHAEANGWPRIAVEMADEPRNIQGEKDLLESMHAFRDNVPWVYLGGSYSVDWGTDEFAKYSQEIFHTLAFSALNSHSQRDLDEAKKQGSDLYIYNQGTTRFSFGMYQWEEYRRGVKGRMQWHMLALHGYQFFDLDGREPDTAMINWGRHEIIPTLRLPRCREGADDFRFAQTLWNLAEKKADTAAGKAAIDFLNGIVDKIPVGHNDRPAGLMSDEEFRAKCIEMIQALQ